MNALCGSRMNSKPKGGANLPRSCGRLQRWRFAFRRIPAHAAFKRPSNSANCMPSSKPLAAVATWLGWNARLKLSLISWTRGAAQKGDVPAFTAARNCRCLALARAQAIKIGSVISPHQNGLDVEDGTVDRHGRPRRAPRTDLR